jgi:hypothetical protein
MDDRTIAKGVAAGRLLFGLLMIVAPRLVARADEPPKPYVWWLRAFGIRDAVLGAGTLAALADPDDDRAARWVQIGAAADTADAASVLVYGRDLDPRGRLATLAIAVPAAVLGWKASSGLAAER